MSEVFSCSIKQEQDIIEICWILFKTLLLQSSSEAVIPIQQHQLRVLRGTIRLLTRHKVKLQQGQNFSGLYRRGGSRISGRGHSNPSGGGSFSTFYLIFHKFPHQTGIIIPQMGGGGGGWGSSEPPEPPLNPPLQYRRTRALKIQAENTSQSPAFSCSIFTQQYIIYRKTQHIGTYRYKTQ